MQVALSLEYRVRMAALLPATLGLGTLAMWIRSLPWPLRIDADGLTLRYHRRIPWNAVKKISVWRDYCDGHVSRMDIHHNAGTSKIPVRGLADGDNVARVILATFKQARYAKHVAPSNVSPALHDDTISEIRTLLRTLQRRS